MTAPWPKSIHPAARGNSWNVLMDCAADAYRGIAEGEKVMALLVIVRDGEGRSAVIVRGRDGTRRVGSAEEVSDEPEAVA